MRKQLTIILILTLAIMPFYAINVNAAPVTMLDNSPTIDYDNYNFCWIRRPHPSAAIYASSAAFGYQLTSGGYVTSVDIYLKNYGSPSGNLFMYIQYADSSYLPNGTTVATSTNTVDISSIGTPLDGTKFTFAFDEVSLSTGIKYAFILQPETGASLDNDNYIKVGVHNNLITGQISKYASSAWAYWSANDPYIVVTGLDAPTPTPTPTATPTGTAITTPEPTSTPTDTMSIIINLFLPTLPFLIIIIICIAFGYMALGVWGAFLGWNIGNLVCYVMGMSNLWVVAGMILVDALLVFGKVSLNKRGM